MRNAFDLQLAEKVDTSICSLRKEPTLRFWVAQRFSAAICVVLNVALAAAVTTIAQE